jgi:hypothetical protein
MYDVGDVVPLGITVTNAHGTPEDATAVVLTVGLPDGTSVTPSVDHVALSGVYTVDYPTTMEGLHTIRWVATGTNATSYQDVFNVREITDQIISLKQARNQLGLVSTDRDDDLRMFIAAAAVAVEDHIGKKLVRRTITGERHRRVCGKILLDRTPVISVTAVAEVGAGGSWDVDDLDVDPSVGLVTTLSGAALYGNLSVTYVAGMRVIPANYLLATRIITEHLWQTMRPFSSSANLQPGALADSLDARSGGLVGFAIPNRALELLGSRPPLVA